MRATCDAHSCRDGDGRADRRGPRSQALKLGSSMLKALQIAVETTKARSSAHKVAKLYPSSRASGDWASDLNIAFDV